MSSPEEEWEYIDIDEVEPAQPEAQPVFVHDQASEAQPSIVRPQGIDATEIIRRGVHSWLEKAVGVILTTISLLVLILLLAWISGVSPKKLMGCLFEDERLACMWATQDEDNSTDPGVEAAPGSEAATGSEEDPGTEVVQETEDPDN